MASSAAERLAAIRADQDYYREIANAPVTTHECPLVLCHYCDAAIEAAHRPWSEDDRVLCQDCERGGFENSGTARHRQHVALIASDAYWEGRSAPAVLAETPA
jgi:hypothetical protein